MPITLASAPFVTTNSQAPGLGLWSDSYTGGATSLQAYIGCPLVAGSIRELTVAVGTVLPAFAFFTARLRKVGLPPHYVGTMITIPTSDIPALPLLLLNGYTTGRTAFATFTTPLYFNAEPGDSTEALAMTWAGSAMPVGGALARSALRYVLSPTYQAEIIGGGRIEAMFDKIDTPGVYAVPGTPMTGRVTVRSEGLAQAAWPSAGQFQGITVLAFSGGAPAQFPAQFTLRINGASTSVTVVMSANYLTAAQTAVASVAFGDLVSIQMTPYSWATGSYFNGWCELTYVPRLAPVPVPVVPYTPPAEAAAGGAAVPGLYYLTGHIAGGTTGGQGDTGLANQIYAHRFIARSGAIIDRVGLFIRTAQASWTPHPMMRIGAYDNASGVAYPSTLIAETAINVDTTGLVVNSVWWSLGAAPRHWMLSLQSSANFGATLHNAMGAWGFAVDSTMKSMTEWIIPYSYAAGLPTNAISAYQVSSVTWGTQYPRYNIIYRVAS